MSVLILPIIQRYLFLIINSVKKGSFTLTVGNCYTVKKLGTLYKYLEKHPKDYL